MKDLLKIKSFFLPHKRYFIFALFSLLVTAGIGIVAPLLLKFLIDDVILKEKFSLVPIVAAAVIGAAVIKGLFQFLYHFIGHKFGIQTVYGLRNALYEKLQFFTLDYYSRMKTGDLMARLTGDVETIRGVLANGILQFANIFFLFIATLSVMAFYSIKLTLVTVIVLVLLIVVSYRFQKEVRPSFRNIRKSIASLNSSIQENVMGIRTVKSFGREDFEVKKFSTYNQKFKDAFVDSARIWSRYFPVMEMLGGFCIVILLGYGGLLVINEELSIGALVSFFSLMWIILAPLTNLGFVINQFMQSITSAERLNELLETEEEIKSPEQPVKLQEEKSSIAFKNVSFGYKSSLDTLSNITLNAEAGKTIGILGSTGSGKSSIIQLIFRAYDTTKGGVYVNGVDTRDLSIPSLRKGMGVVMQEPFLFSARIRDNICYGDPYVSMDKIIYAAKMADAHDFIVDLPDGYDTVVGERGLGLSGGQKQRIAIARALITSPEILILDDATSALDMETEYQVLSNIRDFLKKRTTFMIAHRISSLKNADEIIVLNNGKIMERGTHQELLKLSGIYKTTYDVQHASETDSFEKIRSRAL